MTPHGFKPGDLEVHLSTGKLKKLFGLLKKKYARDGIADAEGRAKVDIAKLLGAAFTKMGKRFEESKNLSLKKLVDLQVKALDFYNHALTSADPPDLKKLERILKDMEKELYRLAKSVTELADEVPPEPPAVVVTTKGKRTVVKVEGGVEKGGATYEHGPDMEPTSFAVHEGSHPGRKKLDLDTPDGMIDGDQIGHGHPEGSVRDPRVAAVIENLEGEAQRSNLSGKKKFDNLVRKFADFYPYRTVTKVVRHKHPGEARPYASSYELILDGVSLYKVTIPNE